MPTDDLKINIYDKKLLSLTGIKTYFLDYLNDKIDERTAAIFQGVSGVLDMDEIEIDPSGNDEFDLDITNAWRVVVGTGEIIDLSQLNGVGITTDIPIENTLTTVYYVGIRFMSIADGIELNPRTGDPEYPAFRDSYGELDNPTSVVDNPGVSLTLNVNSITESGVDHSGRTVKVYLVDPVSAVESVAYYEGTITYNNPNNTIVINYTDPDGPLGQDTSVDPPSTTATDYIVAIEGVTWRKNTDLRTDANYAFIGTITGAGAGNPIGATDLSDQNPVFINTLDRAYDGAAGSGSGRLIYVDNEAVELRSRTGGTDELFASFRIDRKGGTEDAGVCAQFIADQSDGRENCAMHFVPLVHSTSNLIVDNPCDTVATDKVTRTGSVDWSTSGLHVLADFAWLQGFATSDGLYRITNITATQLTLGLLDGGTINLTGSESGNVTILRCVQATGVPLWGSLLTPASGRGPNTFSGLNEDTVPPALAAAFFYGYESDCAKFYDTEAASPVAKTRVTNEGIIDTGGVLIRPEPFSAVGSNPQDRRILGVVMPTADPLDDQPSARMAGVWNHRGSEIERLEAVGRRAHGIRFKDDFHYNAAAWGSGSTVGPFYEFAGSGATPAFLVDQLVLPGGYGTITTNTTGPTSGQSSSLNGENLFAVSTVDLGVCFFYAKIRMPASLAADPLYRIGFYDSGGNKVVTWYADVAGTNVWTLEADDGTSQSSEATTIAPVADAVIHLYIIADPYANSPNGWIGGYIKSNSNEDNLTGFAFPSLTGRFLNLLRLEMYVETQQNQAASYHIDYWEGWMDNNLRSGPEA